MGRQISLIEMIKECEDEQKKESEANKVGEGEGKIGHKEEVLPSEPGSKEILL